MTVQPQTLANELIDKLAGFAGSEKKPTEFEFAVLKREAKKLESIDPAESAMCLGMIACLEGDVEECKKQHEKSIRIGRAINYYVNYCWSLTQFGLIDDYYQCLEVAVHEYPGDPELLSKLVLITEYLGLYDKTLIYADKLIATKAQHDLPVDEVKGGVKLILALGVPAESLQQAYKFVDEVCSKHSVEIESFSLIPVDGGVLRRLETKADVETTVEMNFELFEKFAEAENFDLGGLSISFR